MADLERTKIKVGFIPIIDCAAIVLAEELAPMSVRVSRSRSARGVVGERARQAGARRARRLAHPGAAAARRDARHRQRERAG